MKLSEEEKKERTTSAKEEKAIEGQIHENKAEGGLGLEAPAKGKMRINAEWAKSTLFIFSTIYWAVGSCVLAVAIFGQMDQRYTKYVHVLTLGGIVDSRALDTPAVAYAGPAGTDTKRDQRGVLALEREPVRPAIDALQLRLAWGLLGGAGLASFLLGFVGCSAAIDPRGHLLKLYVAIAVFMIGLELGSASISFALMNQLVETLHVGLDTNLKYYVHQKELKAMFETHDRLITKGFNDIQKEFKCCGIDGPESYDKSVYRREGLFKEVLNKSQHRLTQNRSSLSWSRFKNDNNSKSYTHALEEVSFVRIDNLAPSMKVNSTSNMSAMQLHEEWGTVGTGAEKVMHPDIVARELKSSEEGGAAEEDGPGEKRRMVRERRSEHPDQPTVEHETKKEEEEETMDEQSDHEQAATEAHGSDASNVHSLQCPNFHITCCTVHREAHRWVPTDQTACCTGRPEYASNISKIVCPESVYPYSARVRKTL